MSKRTSLSASAYGNSLGGFNISEVDQKILFFTFLHSIKRKLNSQPEQSSHTEHWLSISARQKHMSTY